MGGEVGLVRIRPEQPLCVEAYAECPELGQFASTREQTAIALMGIIREVQPRQPLTTGGDPGIAAFMAFMAFIAATVSTMALVFFALAAFIAFMAFIAASGSTILLAFFAPM